MRIGDYRRFAIEYRIDFRVGELRRGLVGAFTYWICDTQYGVWELEATCMAASIYNLESKLSMKSHPGMDVLYNAAAADVLAGHRVDMGLDPITDIEIPDAVNAIPSDTWDYACLAPVGDETFDDRSQVVFGMLDDVRICGGKVEARSGRLFHAHINECTIPKDEFVYILSAAVAWVDACPASFYSDVR